MFLRLIFLVEVLMQNKNRIGLLMLVLLFPLLSGCALLVAGGLAAGVGTGVAVSQDRRTSGTFVEDEGIEFKSNRRISEKLGGNVNINVTSFNRNVLLTGEAPTVELKKEAEKLVRGVENVGSVTNEITIAGPSSFGSRSNDALITSKVKARFMDGGKFQVDHVKVVTEDAVVYLLGLVKAKEAESAVDIARSTSGVRKVVKVFEYQD
jgi:osmotically-inducible protein OsmY